MPNHVHLLIKEKQEPLDEIFRSILSGFVRWYNAKYKRVGRLFQDRFRSQPVEDETYFLRAVRYIHRNPLETKLCERMEDYSYSSFSSFFRSGKYRDDELLFDLIRKDEFEHFHLKADEEDNDFLDIDKISGIPDEKAEDLILRSGAVGNISEVRSLSHDERIRMIQTLLRAGASYRQINKLTGIGVSVIRAVSKELHQ